MKIQGLAAATVGLTIFAGAFTSTRAQDKPEVPLRLSGTYDLQHVAVSDDGTVNMDFSATITNEGEKDLAGKLLLRDVSDNEKVWGRFGDNTIPAGGSAAVSGNVTVPKGVFESWSSGGGPTLFFYTPNSRGDVTMFRIPVSRVAAPPPGK